MSVFVWGFGGVDREEFSEELFSKSVVESEAVFLTSLVSLCSLGTVFELNLVTGCGAAVVLFPGLF